MNKRFNAWLATINIFYNDFLFKYKSNFIMFMEDKIFKIFKKNNEKIILLF